MGFDDEASAATSWLKACYRSSSMSIELGRWIDALFFRGWPSFFVKIDELLNILVEFIDCFFGIRSHCCEFKVDW